MLSFNIQPIFPQQPRQPLPRKTSLFHPVLLWIDIEIYGSTQIGFFENGFLKIGGRKVAIVENGFGEVGFFEINLFE